MYALELIFNQSGMVGRRSSIFGKSTGIKEPGGNGIANVAGFWFLF